MFEQLEGEGRALLQQVIELVYFMRGAISYDQMLERTFAERQMISEFVTHRLEAEKAKMYPNY